MSARLLNPPELARPHGYSHGAIGRGNLVAIAGQIGWDGSGKLVGGGIAAQFDQALANVAAVLKAAGGRAEDLVSLRIYVVDKKQYNAATQEIGAAYRKHLGRHFPPMALLQVADLLEPGALVEIEALATVEEA